MLLALRFIDFGWPIVSQTIQWWTSSWVTHVDIVCAGRMISAYPTGVEWRELDEFPAVREETLALEVTTDQVECALAFLDRQLGKPYDYFALMLYPLRINHTRTWFCSALVAATLNEAGILPFARPQLTSPADVYRAVRGHECATRT